MSHELALCLHGLLKLEFDFFLLPVMVYNVPHDFFFALLQLILGLDVLDDELLDRDGAVLVDVDLVEDLVHDLVAHLVVKDLLRTSKKVT